MFILIILFIDVTPLIDLVHAMLLAFDGIPGLKCKKTVSLSKTCSGTVLMFTHLQQTTVLKDKNVPTEERETHQ